MANNISDIDDTFRRAFLYGVYSHKQNHSSEKNYGLSLPLAQSQFMVTLVLPFLPTFTAKQSEQMQMKKTSWKKSHKFIKTLGKEKLLLCKDRPNNEVDVWDIDFEDRAFTGFAPYRLPKKESKSSSERQNEANGRDDAVGQKLKVLLLYRPPDSLARVFERAVHG